jgi:SAM-dependent methyltransferase
MVNKHFNPSIIHPFYFIRRGLFNGISKHAPSLTGRLMDFGCGSKPYKSLFGHVQEYVGVDFHNEGHPHQNEQIDVFYDGKTLPFSDGEFDAVLASEVFEHIFNLEDMVREIHRVMKPGANILVTLPFVWNEHEVPYDFARYSSFGIKDLLSRNGFDVVAIDKTTSFIETITQMKMLYVSTHIMPRLKFITRIPGVGRLSHIVAFGGGNMMGRVLNAIFPKRYDLYLSLVIVAKKKA